MGNDVQGWYCSGTLEKEASLKYTPSGLAILEFELVSKREYETGGQTKTEECSAPCSMFGKRAQELAPLLKAGTRLLVQGRWRVDRWQNDQGQPRSRHRVSVNEVEVLSRASGGGAQPVSETATDDMPF